MLRGRGDSEDKDERRAERPGRLAGSVSELADKVGCAKWSMATGTLAEDQGRV